MVALVAWQRVRNVLVAVYEEAKAENLPFMAAGIAFNTMMSLIPLSILFVLVLTSAGAGSIRSELLELLKVYTTPGADALIMEEVRRATSSTSMSLLGLGALVFGGFGIFQGLDQAFSSIYESERENGLADIVRDSAVALVSVAFILVALVTIEVTVSLGGFPEWLVDRGMMAAALGLIFLPIYYIFPEVDDMRLREIMPGVAVAAGGITFFHSLFHLYIRYGGRDPAGSPLSAIVTFLLWLNLSSLLVLLGAALNAVLADRTEDVAVVPVTRAEGPD